MITRSEAKTVNLTSEPPVPSFQIGYPLGSVQEGRDGGGADKGWPATPCRGGAEFDRIHLDLGQG